jgi:hypothetical protein
MALANIPTTSTTHNHFRIISISIQLALIITRLHKN